MKIDLKVKGLDEVLTKLSRFPGDLEKVTERVLKQAARGIAAEAGKLTGHGGLSEKQGEKSEKKIAREARLLFPAKTDGGRIYDAIKAKDDVLAKQFYAAFKSGDVKRTNALMRKAGVPSRIDESAHQRLRKSGGVKASTLPLAAVAQGTQRAYIRRHQKLTGLVKGGWFAAGKSLGGRQRTQTTEGKSIETFPKYVRRHGKRSSIGGSSYRGGKNARLIIWNSVRHIGEVMPSGLQRKAVAGAQHKLAKAFQAELKYLNRKRGRR